jgi:hypothetical protein
MTASGTFIFQILICCQENSSRARIENSPRWLGGEAGCWRRWCTQVVQTAQSSPTAHEPPELAAPTRWSHSHVLHSMQSACCHLLVTIRPHVTCATPAKMSCYVALHQLLLLLYWHITVHCSLRTTRLRRILKSDFNLYPHKMTGNKYQRYIYIYIYNIYCIFSNLIRTRI